MSLNYAIKSKFMELLGNAAYSKTLVDKAIHVDIHVRGEGTSKLTSNELKNDWGYNDVCEVETFKNEILWNLRFQVDVFDYMYARLRMLELYYDLLDKFVARADFQLCLMDTDCLYLALSKRTLDGVVEPAIYADMLNEF